MLDVTKIAVNTCLTVINCGLTISTPSIARKLIVQDFELCPKGVYECPKERYYYIAINVVLYVSAMLGCFISLFFKSANRRHRLIGIHYLYVTSGILSMYCPHFILFLFVQAIAGVALGLSLVTVTSYIFEYSPQKYHKYYGSFMQMFFAIGLFLSYIFGVCYENIDVPNYATSATIVKVLQKIHFAVPILVSIIALLMLHFVFKYDTPYHLYATKNYEKYDKLKMNMKSLRNINEQNEYEDKGKQKTLVVLIKRDLALLDIWENVDYRRLLYTGCILCLFYAFNGYFFFFSNSFLFYKIFESMLINNLFTLGFIFLYFTFSISTMALLLHLKKKTLLLTGIFIQILALIGIVVLNFISLAGLTLEIILTISMCAVFVGLSLGYGPSLWTFVSHHFPNTVKGVGSCICYSVLFFGALIINVIYELLQKKHYVYLFITFLSSTILSLIFIYFYYMDVNDKSLKELKTSRQTKVGAASAAASRGETQHMQSEISHTEAPQNLRTGKDKEQQ